MRTTARRALRILVVLVTFAPPTGLAQTRSMAQDPTLNNLRHAPGTATTAPDTLGRVRKIGSGPRTLILIPGLGFGDTVWSEFMDRRAESYTMYAVTLPGFGDTPPWPMPGEGGSYAERPWMNSAVTAIERLMDAEKLPRVTLVAHWAFATQVALRLALDHPDRVEAVILAGGVLRSYFSFVPGMADWNLKQRAGYADGMAQKWFKTVTRTTWDDNNFMPYDYAVHPLRALFLWRQAQSPSLPVWIRYLLEFYGLDLAADLAALRVPTLVVQPGFDDGGFVVDGGRDYMRDFLVGSWHGAPASEPPVEFVTVPRSRLFVMYDQPEQFDAIVERFLTRHGARAPRE
jgi:pimeloyl-ACP methyl ester carboxylesterase